MKKPLQIGLIAGLVAILAIGALEAALAKSENDFFQFCTTKAYGWPAPWAIEYCECEGATTVHPTTSKIVNVGAVAGGGFLSFAFIVGLATLSKRKH